MERKMMRRCSARDWVLLARRHATTHQSKLNLDCIEVRTTESKH
jgi:hypothetical protein